MTAHQIIEDRLGHKLPAPKAMRPDDLTKIFAREALKTKTNPVAICECCKERPVAYPDEGECIECYTANTSEDF